MPLNCEDGNSKQVASLSEFISFKALLKNAMEGGKEFFSVVSACKHTARIALDSEIGLPRPDGTAAATPLAATRRIPDIVLCPASGDYFHLRLNDGQRTHVDNATHRRGWRKDMCRL